MSKNEQKSRLEGAKCPYHYCPGRISVINEIVTCGVCGLNIPEDKFDYTTEMFTASVESWERAKRFVHGHKVY